MASIGGSVPELEKSLLVLDECVRTTAVIKTDFFTALESYSLATILEQIGTASGCGL